VFITGEYIPKKARKRKSTPKNTIDCCMKCANKNRCELRCTWAFDTKCLNKCTPGGCTVIATDNREGWR